MSRDSCVTHLHQHVGQCRAAGYANGRADALDEIEQRILMEAPVEPSRAALHIIREVRNG